jgi:hypothetical protein
MTGPLTGSFADDADAKAAAPAIHAAVQACRRPSKSLTFEQAVSACRPTSAAAWRPGCSDTSLRETFLMPRPPLACDPGLDVPFPYFRLRR